MNQLSTRHVARVVVVDASGSVLLCRYAETREACVVSFWVPPGGALEPGENHLSAAARELQEETGLVIHPEHELWERRFTLHMRGGPVDQVERYFLARLSSERPAVMNHSSEDIQDLRWWSLPELRATDETIYPDGFVEQLTDILAGRLRNTIRI